MGALADHLTRQALELGSTLLATAADTNSVLAPRHVHRARVGGKRLRAAWELVAPAAPAMASAAIARLRACNAILAPARRIQAVAETLADLIADAHTPRRLAALTAMRDALPAATTPRAGTLGDVMRAESAAWRSLPSLPADGILAGHVQTTCARAMRRLRRARRTGAADDYHRARMLTKRLLYQIEWLCPQPQTVLGGGHAALKELGEVLGNLQDLLDLQHAADEVPLRKAERRTLEKLLRRRAGKQMSAADRLAQTTFAADAVPAAVAAWVVLCATHDAGSVAGDHHPIAVACPPTVQAGSLTPVTAMGCAVTGDTPGPGVRRHVAAAS